MSAARTMNTQLIEFLLLLACIFRCLLGDFGLVTERVTLLGGCLTGDFGALLFSTDLAFSGSLAFFFNIELGD